MSDRLSRDQTEAICKRVYSRCPVLKGVRPRVSQQRAKGELRFLLRFEKTVQLPDGKALPTVVRVVANSNGKIIKLTSSR